MPNVLKVSDSTKLIQGLQTTIYSLWIEDGRSDATRWNCESIEKRLTAISGCQNGHFEGAAEPKPAISSAESKSHCGPLVESIEAKTEQGLSA
jgi:hypothetical protein